MTRRSGSDYGIQGTHVLRVYRHRYMICNTDASARQPLLQILSLRKAELSHPFNDKLGLDTMKCLHKLIVSLYAFCIFEFYTPGVCAPDAPWQSAASQGTDATCHDRCHRTPSYCQVTMSVTQFER